MKKLFATRLMIDASGRLIMMGVVIFLSRRLGVEAFGQLAYGLSIVNISYFLCDFGVATLFLREMGRISDAQRDEVWEKFFGLKVVLATAVLIIGSLLSFKLWRWNNPEILIALYISMIGNCFIDFFGYACNALQNLKASAVMLLVHKGLVALGVLLVCIYAPTLEHAAVALAIGSALGMALSFIVLKKSLHLPIKLEWKPKEWGMWLKATVPLALSNILVIAYGRFGILMLPSLRGETETGIYAAAHRIFEVGYIVPAALVGVLTTRLSKSHNESAERFSADFWKSLRSIALLMVAGLLIVEPLAPYVIHFLFGEAYMAAVPALRILMLVNALVVFNVFFAHVMIVYNQLKWNAVNAVITAIVAGILSYFLVGRHGGMGAAASLLLAEGVFTCLAVFALIRLSYNKPQRARSSAG